MVDLTGIRRCGPCTTAMPIGWNTEARELVPSQQDIDPADRHTAIGSTMMLKDFQRDPPDIRVTA